jgi:cation diffusion facilitator CzcD-associated flavoprotein CzcO
VIHTASWPKDYDHDQWRKEKVAVIGSGASSIQTVPGMQVSEALKYGGRTQVLTLTVCQPFVQHMDIFVRTAVWFVQIARNYGQNYEHSENDKSSFRKDKRRIVEHARDLEDQVNGIFDGFFRDSNAQKELRDTYTARMTSMIKDEKLRKGFTPRFAVGCRRVTPGYVMRKWKR